MDEYTRAAMRRLSRLFPTIMPYDDSPITADVCAALGMQRDIEAKVYESWCDGRGTHVEIVGGHGRLSDELSSVNTVGRLAMLIAARRADV